MKSPLSEDEIFVLNHHPEEAENIIYHARLSGISPIDVIKRRDKITRDIAEHRRILRWVEEHPAADQ